MTCKGEGMGVSGGQREKSSLTGAMVRYGHIDANALWPQPSCADCRQKPTNVSGCKTHKSQEPCLMAPQHRQKVRKMKREWGTGMMVERLKQERSEEHT